MIGTPLVCTVALLLLCGSASAQPPASAASPEPGKLADTLHWASGLRDRLSQTQDPVVKTYGLARLGGLICALDKEAGARLIHQSYSALRSVPDEAFDEAPAPLLVSSFTALSKSVIEAATACGAGGEASTDQAVIIRTRGEWMKANAWLNKALETKDPSRAAQLADAALHVSRLASALREKALIYGRKYDFPPGVVFTAQGHFMQLPRETLDLSLFSRSLAKVKGTAPDLADGLFQKTLDGMLSASPPTAAELAELARHLFPTGSSIQLPVDSRWVISPPGGLPMPNFMHAELKGNFDLAVAFLDKAGQAVQNYETTSADALDAYALAWQMLPKAREFALEDVSAFQTALLTLEPQLGANAAKIRGDLGPAPSADPYGAPQSDFVAAAKVLSHIRAGRFDAARAGLSGLGNTAERGQVESLIDFEEAAQSLPSKDAERALELPIYPKAGAKRALLYTAVVRAAGNRDGALRALQMALQEAEPLPTAQRLCILPALASAALPVDADQSVEMLRQLVKAENDASREPVEKPPMRCGVGGLVEEVDAEEGRQGFLLSVPGVSTYTLDAFLAEARNVEFSRLESAVLELHDENRRVEALLTLAERCVRGGAH